jgi:hypothetical protein
MKRLFLAVLTVTLCTGLAFAQRARSTHSTSASNETSASTNGKQVNLASIPRWRRRLENSLDARHAKVGDRLC